MNLLALAAFLLAILVWQPAEAWHRTPPTIKVYVPKPPVQPLPRPPPLPTKPYPGPR